MYGWDILCCSLWNSTKISYLYIERYVFYIKLNFQELLDLRAHKCFWNAPLIINTGSGAIHAARKEWPGTYTKKPFQKGYTSSYFKSCDNYHCHSKIVTSLDHYFFSKSNMHFSCFCLWAYSPLWNGSVMVYTGSDHPCNFRSARINSLTHIAHTGSSFTKILSNRLAQF